MLLQVMIGIVFSMNAAAEIKPYISVGLVKSLKSKTPSSQVGEEVKFGLMFNRYISGELAARSLGQHSYTNSTNEAAKFTAAGYGIGVKLKPLGYWNLYFHPYISLSLNTVLTNIYEQGDVFGSPAIKEGTSSLPMGAVGFETVVFVSGLSFYGEVVQMYENSLQSPFIHTTVGLSYHFD